MSNAFRSYPSVLLLAAGALGCVAQSPSELPFGRFHPSGSPVRPLDAGAPKARRTAQPLPPQFLNLPLYFEPGSSGASLFRSQGLGYRMDFNARGAVLRFGAASSGNPLSLTFERANRSVSIGGEDPLSSRSNYLVGTDPSSWRTDVANYGRLRYREVWPGVDLVFYGSQQTLEYDVLVAPGADLDKIRFRLDGAKKIAIEKDGSMTVETRDGVFRQRPPVVYQESNGARRSLSGRYVLLSKNRIGFKVDGFDKSRRLVIDPVIDYSTYLGGSQTDAAYGIAVDSTGAVYITGLTTSAGIASPGAYQPLIAPGATNAFVVKLDPTGTRRIYSTYIGGSGSDIAWSIAVDSAGEAHIAGQTTSANFPTVSDSNDVSWTRAAIGAGTRGFVAKVNTNGNGLIYAYKIAGTGNENINGFVIPEAAWQLALDSSGNAYIVGVTVSQDFPTRSAFQSFLSSTQNGYLAKLNPSGDRFYSSYVGLQDQFGDSAEVNGYAVTVDPFGNAYIAGVAAFTAQSSFVYYLQANTNGQLGYIKSIGGSAYQEPWRLAADANSNLYLCGYTTSTDFPVTALAFQRNYGGGLWDAFVARFDQNGNTVFSTFLGGSGGDSAFSLRLNSAGNIVVAGRTNSHDFPIQPGAVQQTFAGGLFDGFVLTMAANGGSLLNSTFLGGSNDDEIADVAVGPNGSLYVAGYTTSLNYPTTPGAYLNAIPGAFSSFVTKLDDPSVCSVSITSGEVDLSQNAAGGSVSVQSSPSSCNWAASTDSSWITLGQTSGSGSLSVPFTAAPNPLTAARSGTIKVNASSVKVFQFPQTCNFVIAPNSVLVSSAGGAQDIYLLVPLGSTCGWNASTDSPSWVTILNPNGQGAGVLHLSIAANTGTLPQSGNVTVGGQTIPLYQNPSTCVYSLSGSVFPFDTNGGSGVVNVITTGPTCKWTASDPSDSWIQVIDKAGQGNGQVRFNVSPQGSLANLATSLRISSNFVVAGETFSVIQGYLYVDPRGGAGSAGSGSAPLAVWRPGVGHMPASVHPLSSGICNFTGFSGGLTSLTFNPGDPPAQVTLTYSGTCAELAPQPVDSSWKVTGPGPTFTITPPTSQPGNTLTSTIHFLNLVIGAQAILDLPVTRNGNVCTVQPPQAPATVPATGASTAVSVAVAPTSDTCGISATATTSDGSNWLTFPNGSTQNPGTYVGQASGGAGQIPFTAATNNSPTQRTATINVNGTTFNVVQAGVTPACTVSVSATMTADNTAQSLIIPVAASADSCAWSTSAAGTGFSGSSSGTGNGGASVTLSANTGSSSRTGTVTVTTAGSNSASVTIVQNGVPVVSCSYSVSPTSAPSIIAAAGGGGSFTVTTTSGCSWTPTDPDSWVTVAPAFSQSGSGQVTYTVAANTGGQRSSIISIASGVAFSLTQAGANISSATFTLTPNPIQVCDGSGLGQGTVSWNVPGATSVEVRFAGGTAWVAGGASGSSQTGKWVSNGLQFLLFDTSFSPAGVQVGSITASLTTAGCTGPPPTVTFTLTPNPIQVCDGSGLGQATVAWSVPGATSVAIRFGNGSAWITGGASGSSQTGKWVSNGLQFLLFDTSNSAAGVQVGSITATLTTAGCTGPPPTATFTLTPNPIQVCDGSGLGQGTVSWNVPGATSVAIRFGNGSAWITGGASGSSQTGKWVSNGLQFLLFDTSNSAAGVQVGSITATLTTAGCTTPPPPTCSYSVSPTAGSAPAAGGTGTFTVNAPSGCPWAVSWAVSWLSATPLTGSGTATVTYTVAANSGPTRSGSITTIATGSVTADVVFAISQAGSAISGGAPPAQLINNNGGDWAFRAFLGSSNVTFTGAQVASDTLAILSNTGDNGYFLYPSSSSPVQVLWDLRNYQALNLSIAAIVSSTQGIPIAPGTPSVTLTSTNGQMTITPVTSSPLPAPTFYNYQVPLNGAPGWVAVPTGTFNPAAVTSVQVGFRVLNQGFIFYLADVSFQ